MSKQTGLDFGLLDEITKEDACVEAVVAVADAWRKKGFGQGYKAGFESGRVGGIMLLVSAFVMGALACIIAVEVAKMSETPVSTEAPL